MALNTSGNYKGGKFLKTIPGQGVKTHDIVEVLVLKIKLLKDSKKDGLQQKLQVKKYMVKLVNLIQNMVSLQKLYLEKLELVF